MVTPTKRAKDRAAISDRLIIESSDASVRAQDALREFVEKQRPTISGHVTVELRSDRTGRLQKRVTGENILTLTGREFYTELAVLAAFSGPGMFFRNDRLGYFGLGKGAQAEVPEVLGLVDPVEYLSGQFLAAVQAPATFPASVTTRTVSRLTREYGRSEISFGGAVVVTEAGIFSNGDPADNWNTAARPTDMASTSADSPFFYKAFEPVTKTVDTTLRLIWELRVV